MHNIDIIWIYSFNLEMLKLTKLYYRLYLQEIGKQVSEQQCMAEQSGTKLLESIGEHITQTKMLLEIIEEIAEINEKELCESYKLLYETKIEYEIAELELEIICEAK